MIRASELLHRATDRLHEDLHALVTRRLPGEGFEDRRALIARFVHSSRRALTQLLILLEWLRARQAQTQGPLEAGAALVQGEAEQLRLTLDRLFYAHRDLFRKRVASRPYDLPTALDLLAEGTTAHRFPRELDLSLQNGAAEEGPSVEELNHAIHAALILREGAPPQFSHSRVEYGVLRLEERHQFALSLTLESVADPATAPWRLLDLQFLLPRLHVDKAAGAEQQQSQQQQQQQQQQQYHALEPDARQRQRVFELLMGILETDPEPLLSAHRVCRALCDGLRLEMLALQAKALVQDRSTIEEERQGGQQQLFHLEHEPGHSMELRFWRGLPLLPPTDTLPSQQPHDDDAMDVQQDDGPAAGGEGRGGESITRGDDDDEGRLCVLRIALEQGQEGGGKQWRGPKRLRATCGHRDGKGKQKRWDASGGRSLALAPARISLPDVLEQAYTRLVPARLLWLRHCFLGPDPALGALLQEGGGLSLRMAPGGMSLVLSIAGAGLAVSVDRRTGHFVLSPLLESDIQEDGDLPTLLHEWEAALRADPALEAPMAKEAASRLLRDILRALLLRRVAAIARARFDLPADPRWRRLLALGAGAEAEPGEEEADGVTASAAAVTNVHLLLASTAAVLPPPAVELGAMWQLLEVEVTDLSSPPEAYLVTAGPRADGMPSLPTLRARRRLAPTTTTSATAGVGEEGLAAWLGSAVDAARAALRVASVLDAVAGALGLGDGRLLDGAAELVLAGGEEWVELWNAFAALGKNGKGNEGGGRRSAAMVEGLSVQHDPANGTWRWRARVPGQAANLVTTVGGHRVLWEVDGERRVALAWGQQGRDAGEVEVAFTGGGGGGGGWHALLQARHVSRAVAAVARLVAASNGAKAAAGAEGFELVGGGPLPELRFQEAAGPVLALRDPALELRQQEDVREEEQQRLRVVLLDGETSLLAGSRVWRAVEEEFAATGDLGQLLRRVRPLVRPLHAVGKALAGMQPVPPLDVVAWAPMTVAITTPASVAERLLLLTVLPAPEGERPEGVVRLTRHVQGEGQGGDARQQGQWAVGEFTPEVAGEEMAFLFED